MIKAIDIGKKYGGNWIFRHLDTQINKGSSVAITGKNGSGKSTLLQILSGFLTPSEGEVLHHNKEIDYDQMKSVFVGPYTEIIEEFTLKEFLSFQQQFKKPLIPIEVMAERASLPLNKLIAEFSTGMKQRAKLITVFFYKNDFIFMDEPTSNLDAEGLNWWKKETEMLENKLILIASNQSEEIEICSEQINL